MDPLLENVGPILTLLGALAAAYLTYRASNRKLKSDSELLMIDQLQEENVGLRAECARRDRTIRLQDDYIAALRRHIADGQPPPPPAWPDGLIA